MARHTPRKEPLGDRIRDLINPALEDRRKQQIQLDLLNNFFQNLTLAFRDQLEWPFSEVFNHAASLEEDKKNPFIIEQLTKLTPFGSPEYSPSMVLQVPLALKFTEFSADEVKDLPAYILLHEALRAENVAIRILGLVVEDVKSSSGLNPAVIIIDASKTYEQGAMENSSLYPNLPEVDSFEIPHPKRFKIGE